ncbi:MAG: hypothetical protein J5932_09895 [Prevotella sp.]|nr:hypothetical protein [Prevotella sp.]
MNIEKQGWLFHLFLPSFTADCRHWEPSVGSAKGEVSVLSSRHSVAIALYPARPDSVIQQQKDSPNDVSSQP